MRRFFLRWSLTSAPLTYQRTLIITVLLTSVSLSGCQWPWSDRGSGATLFYSGTIEARETDLAFQVSGRIARLMADEGDTVKAGQPVAGLYPRDYDLNLARTRAEADAARSSLDLLKAGARSQEVKVAEAAVVQARAQLKFAEAESRRIARLVPQHLASQDQLDRARMQQDIARATLTQSQQQLALLEAGARKEEISRAQADYQAKEQAVAVAQQQRDYVDLASPVTGTVTTRLAEAGEVVTAGQPVLRVASVDKPWVRIYINEKDLPHVHLGQSARVSIDGMPGRAFSGKLVFIAAEAEFTPKTVETRELRVDLVYRAKVEVANPDGTLKIGMPADVDLSANSS